MKKKCFCALAIFALASTMPLLAIEETQDEAELLYGTANQKEIYSYANQ